MKQLLLTIAVLGTMSFAVKAHATGGGCPTGSVCVDTPVTVGSDDGVHVTTVGEVVVVAQPYVSQNTVYQAAYVYGYNGGYGASMTTYIPAFIGTVNNIMKAGGSKAIATANQLNSVAAQHPEIFTSYGAKGGNSGNK